MIVRWRILSLLVWSGAFAGTLPVAQAGDGSMTRPQAYERAAHLAVLGRNLFADPSLSASGRMACATCHDPNHAFGPPNALAVQFGGADMKQPGLRAVPSLK